MKSLMTKILTGALVLIFLFSGWKLTRIYSEYKAADVQYEALEQYVSPAGAVPSGLPDETGDEEAAEPQSPQPPQVDFGELAEINPDIAAWLTIEGTRIHYPVVQGTDNEFYLTHQFDGQANSAGCLFLDAANDASFQQANQIIYGHYMKNQSMFHDLANYKEQAFFDEHPAGWLMTPTAAYRLRFFSGYVCDVYEDAWEIRFSENSFAEWLETCREKSMFTSNVLPAADCCVLTLSTCSYEYQDARFVLHAVLEPIDP